MFHDPSMTFLDMIVRVADETGKADESDGVAQGPPTDAITLAKIKRTINDAAQEFARKRPWSWLTPEIQITLSSAGTGPHSIDSDPSRYVYPAYVQSAPVGKVTWSFDGLADAGEIVFTNIERLNVARAGSPDTTGAPLYMAMVPTLAPGNPETTVATGSRPGLKFVVHPAPDQNYVIRSRHRVWVMPLINNTDKGIWPGIHDLTVVYEAIAKLSPGNEDRRARATNAYAESIRLDFEMAPKRLGRMTDGGNFSRWVDRTPLYDNSGAVLVP